MSEQFKTAAEHFAAVVDLDPFDRKVELDRRLAADPALWLQVQMLLDAHDMAWGFSPSAGAVAREQLGERLAEPSTATGAQGSSAAMESQELADQTLRESVGSRVGPYELLYPLGEGGFGVVYLAEQEQPIRRRVAVKLIKRGMDTNRVVARFEAERQALAMMDHPAIARVFDAGVTDSGNPYFAMEYVRGAPITGVCDRQRMAVDDRLRLFVQVCGGVQHAHTKGVIHRDLKPSNILAMVDGSSGGVAVAPKIIDFGVSKALTDPTSGRTLVTEGGQLLGTPEYMSPEQADPSSVDIDTRSDIYSLGVLLYELLTGSRPFETTSLRGGGVDRVLQIIRESEPARPSTRFDDRSSAALSASHAAIAACRRVDVNALRRRLRGDLDWIVMKCLEKERSRRYESVHALAADVQRYLAHEAVLAGPPSARYRFGKFLRRHRGAAIAAGLVAVALGAGAVGTGVGLVKAVSARDEERKQRRVAENEAAIASATLAFVNEDLLSAAKPSKRGIDVTVREVLAKAAEAIGDRFQEQPLVEAAIRRTLGTTYVALGKYDLAEPQLERALELRRGEFAHDHATVLESMDDLATLRRRQGRFEESENLHIAVRDARRRALGDGDPLTCASTNNLGVLYLERGRLAEAEPLLQATLAHRQRTLGSDDVTTLRSMANLAALYRRDGRLDEAEPLAVAVLEARRRLLGDSHPETLYAIGNLATIYTEMRRPSDAAPLLEESVPAHRRVFTDQHPDTLTAIYNLAVLRNEQGQRAEAEAMLREVLEGRRRVLPANHGDTLATMNVLASTLNGLERWEEALPLIDEAIAASRAAEPNGSARLGYFLCTAGSSLIGLGRHEEAEAVLLEAHATIERTLGPDHPRGPWCESILIRLYDAWGKPEQAAAWRGRRPASPPGRT